MVFDSASVSSGGAGVEPVPLVARMENVEAVQPYLLRRAEEAERRAAVAQALAEQLGRQVAENARKIEGMVRLSEIMAAAGSVPGGAVPPARHAGPARRDRHGLRLIHGGMAALAMPLALARHVGVHRALVSAALIAAAGGTVAAPSLMMGPPPPAHAAADPDHRHRHHHAGRRDRVVELPPAVIPRRPRRTRGAGARAGAHPSPVPSPHSSPGPTPTAVPSPSPSATDPGPSPSPSCAHGNSCHGADTAAAALAGEMIGS